MSIVRVDDIHLNEVEKTSLWLFQESKYAQRTGYNKVK